jgi:hypothetical protein
MAAYTVNRTGSLADIRDDLPDLKSILSIDGVGVGAEGFHAALDRANDQGG